jgi:SRSO17 transposase
MDESNIITRAGWEAAFETLCNRLAPHFPRPETRERGRRYLLGLLSQTERKNGWQLAESMHEPGPHRMQRLLNAAQWDAEAVRDVLRAYVVAHLGTREGVLVLDETGFLKKGSHSVGVQRQYSGTAGRIENCQIGVFLAYASQHGYAFIDRALYLPEEWVQDPQRCQAAGVPETVPFAPKTQLAQQMLARADAAGVPARWVVADTVYRADDLRLWLEEQGYWYVLAVTCTHSVWTAGHGVEVATLAADLPATAWVGLSAGCGSKGERVYEWAWLRLPYTQPAEMAHWLLIRRSLHDPHDLAYYLAYAPTSTSLTELVQVAGTRWVIETAFAQAKGEVGLDQYQVRRWTAWYRHITFALLAHAYRAVLQTSLPSSEPDLVPVSVPELRRLHNLLGHTPAECRHRLTWSRWRRPHQATAQRCHRQRRQQSAVSQLIEVPCAVVLPGIGPLTEAAWLRIAALLPARRTRVGRPTTPHRQLLEAMLAVMHQGVAWRSLPAALGPWQTVYDRYNEWVKSGLWAQIVPILGDCTPSASGP